MPRPLLMLVLAAALPLAACGSGKSASTTASTTTAAPAAATTAQPAKDSAGCTTVAKPTPPGPGHLSKPSLRLSAAKRYTVTLKTNCGTIAIRLDVRRAPKTSSSVAALVKRGFYDGLTFHRIVPGFVIQGGDPEGTGQGGPGYEVVEAPPRHLKYTHGLVAMAKTGTDPAGASGSQFFIVTAKDAQLPAQYALVGRVVSGMTAVARISAEPADANGLPESPVVIQRATLASG